MCGNLVKVEESAAAYVLGDRPYPDDDFCSDECRVHWMNVKFMVKYLLETDTKCSFSCDNDMIRRENMSDGRWYIVVEVDKSEVGQVVQLCTYQHVDGWMGDQGD